MRNIIIGILFIAAAFTGHFVLIGTDSSIALVIVGFVYIVWGIAKIDYARDRKRRRSGKSPQDDFKKPSNFDY